jgi:hypothetical protein
MWKSGNQELSGEEEADRETNLGFWNDRADDPERKREDRRSFVIS